MRLAISNLGWSSDKDEMVYKLVDKYGFSGIEIAPTRIVENDPYNHVDEVKRWVESIKIEYDVCIPSMQSIWYGRVERIFGSENERQFLIEYTKKAILFAEAISCGNMVFGCPKNRNIMNSDDYMVAIDFFEALGNYAYKHRTTIGLEANPHIYNTNFINDTKSALDFINRIDSKGFSLNLDIGTMIYNDEKISEIEGHCKEISHVHISEPYLKPIEKREIHKSLAEILKNEDYKGFVSIEMGKSESVYDIEKTMDYVRETFG